MPNGEDWLFRPLLRGMFKYESLLDGSLDIGDIRKMNMALDLEAENTYRSNEHNKNK